MLRRLPLTAALIALTCCKDGSTTRGADGGGFVLPDAGFHDAGFRDSGLHDAGPYICDPACSGGEVCGCILNDCGCHPPGTAGDFCDPGHPETCAAPSQCVRARRAGVDIFLCSNGRDGISCSKTADICTTALGCVCYTDSTATTDCRCLEQHDPNNQLCDRMVPETCANGVCVRTTNTAGLAWFFCSDGAEGNPCERNDGSCQTSLGCACPLVFGREVCTCSEPAGEGEPCDPNLGDACMAPLMCYPVQRPNEGVSTVCSDGPPGVRDGGSGVPGGCDPNDPNSCPPGETCLFTGQGWHCV